MRRFGPLAVLLTVVPLLAPGPVERTAVTKWGFIVGMSDDIRFGDEDDGLDETIAPADGVSRRAMPGRQNETAFDPGRGRVVELAAAQPRQAAVDADFPAGDGAIPAAVLFRDAELYYGARRVFDRADELRR